jgi:multidrug efflux pump subunit AcrA (membrane-fusion protein)
VVEAGKAVVRRVELGTRHAGRIQVLAGLASGETVVVAGVQQVRAGMNVADAGAKTDDHSGKQRGRPTL